MKVLVLSVETWTNTTNGGNVFSNIFDGTNFEFAHIYCSPGVPDNTICQKYFQITDRMVLKNILTRAPIGRKFTYQSNTETKTTVPEAENKRLYTWLRKHSSSLLLSVQELAWRVAKVENERLVQFVQEFNPDVIFAPCGASLRLLRLTRFVADLTGKPVVSYVYDDVYSTRQFRVSAIYWIKRFILRASIRQTVPYYALLYTMTEQQKIEFENEFDVKMKILRKGIDTSALPTKNQVNKPIKFIYGGGIYCGRWKMLSVIADAIEKLNAEGFSMHLDIYTGNVLTQKQSKCLNRAGVSQVHGQVPYANLKKIYTQQDIALHVEALDLKNRLLTRLSFSTKIVDCLSSGCATMAIAWKEQAGFLYLQQQKAAFCIHSIQSVYDQLKRLNDE